MHEANPAIPARGLPAVGQTNRALPAPPADEFIDGKQVVSRQRTGGHPGVDRDPPEHSEPDRGRQRPQPVHSQVRAARRTLQRLLSQLVQGLVVEPEQVRAAGKSQWHSRPEGGHPTMDP